MLNIKKLFSKKAAVEEAFAQKPFFVDVRSPEEFAEGSVEGAVNVPVDQLPARMAEIPKDRTVIVFCRSGSRSDMAKMLLDSSGYTQVTNGGGVNSLAAQWKAFQGKASAR